MIHSSVNRFILLNIQSKSEDYAIYGYSNLTLDCIMEKLTCRCQIGLCNWYSTTSSNLPCTGTEQLCPKTRDCSTRHCLSYLPYTSRCAPSGIPAVVSSVPQKGPKAVLFKPLRNMCARCNLARETSRFGVHQGWDNFWFGLTTALVGTVDRVILKVPKFTAPVAPGVL